MASATPIMLAINPMKIMPPAMPKIPEIHDVMRAASKIKSNLTI